jgi:hypothetical protein
MEKAQITKKKKLTVLITIVRRQNLSEKEIPLLYSAERKGNLNITNY